MKKRLLINLLLTLILSFIGTGLIFVIWYNSAEMGFEERQATAILFILVTVIQNLVMTLFALTILFQINATNYLNSWTKISYLYFVPIAATLLFLLYFFSNVGEKIVFAFLIAPAIFSLVSSYFYRQLIKRQYS